MRTERGEKMRTERGEKMRTERQKEVRRYKRRGGRNILRAFTADLRRNNNGMGFLYERNF